MFPAGERCMAIAAAQVVLPSRQWSFHLSCRGLVISLVVAKQVFDRDRNWMLKASSAHVVTIKIFFALMSLFPPFFLVETEEFGPVFIQEPDDVIYPLDTDEKKVVMHCEARGNPPPTYRCDKHPQHNPSPSF